MSNCENYVSEEDIRALKESEQHIEHVARSRNATGDKALSVTDTIRGESVTNRTLDGLEELYQNALSNIGYQQMGDYTTGITIDGRDQIVFHDGSWYMYRGDLPHVTAGETLPDDGGIWSDINPDGLWVDVGDASLRSELKSGDGSLIGVGNGETLKERLDKLHTIFTPEMYLLGDEEDHTEAFKKALSDAKLNGGSFYAGGDYNLTASENNPILIDVNADMSQATITCSTNDGNNTNWGNVSNIFKITQGKEDKTDLFKNVSFFRGMKETGVTGLSGALFFVSTDVWLQRKSSPDDDGTPQFKIETNETNQSGILSYENYFSYTNNPAVYYKPFVHKLEVRLPKVILDGSGIRSVLSCERNNVDIKSNQIISKNNGFAMEFISFNQCSRLNVDGYSLDAKFSDNYSGGYALLLTQCSTIGVNNINSLSGWSGIDGNYYRGLSVRDSKLMTIGGHSGISDVFMQNCTITHHCNGMGWGTWVALNCHHNLSKNKESESFWSTKYDYANSWDGKIIIRDLKVTLHSKCVGHSIVTAMEPKADHSMIGFCPDITIEVVEYDIANTNPGMDLRGINLGVSTGNNFEQYQVLPQFHTLRGVSFGGGTNRYLGNTNYRAVYNERNYSSVTSSQMSLINRFGVRYILKVSDIDVERLGRLNQDWVNAAYVDGFKFTSVDIKQDIYIENSPHVIPKVSAWTNMKITVSKQRMNKGFIDNAVTRTGNTSYNKITFDSCEIFGLGGTSPTYRSGIFDFVGCVFRWDADSDKQIASPNPALGANFGSGPQVIGRVQASVIGFPPSSGTLDSTFKSRVLNGFIDGGVYTTS